MANAVQAIATHIGKAMVATNTGLTLFNKRLDRENCDVVAAYLNQLVSNIVAVWIAARPINGVSGYKFEHWCIKIQAPTFLVTLDFLESDGRGKFRLSVTAANDKELNDFLIYYEQLEYGKRRRKWRIVSSVTPYPAINDINESECKIELDPHAADTLKKYAKAVKKTSILDQELLDENVLIKMRGNKKTCDISDFILMWSEIDVNCTQKDKPYNAVTSNCQQFALDLFKYLVGANYPKHVSNACKQLQSPHDIKLHQKHEIFQEKDELKSDSVDSDVNVSIGVDEIICDVITKGSIGDDVCVLKKRRWIPFWSSSVSVSNSSKKNVGDSEGIKIVV